MLFELKKASILLFIFVPTLALAQTVEYKEDIKTRPITYQRVQLEVVVGLGISKLPVRPTRLTRNALPTPYTEIALVIPVTSRWRVRSSISYQVIGNSFKYVHTLGQRAIANRRLDYLSAQLQAGYLLSKPADRTQIELQSGFFAAKLLDDLTVNRIPDQGVNRLKSIDSSIDYNYGIVTGIGVSRLINQRYRLGIKMLYHQGIIDIRTPLSKQNTGELPIVTQAFSFCTFFSM